VSAATPRTRHTREGQRTILLRVADATDYPLVVAVVAFVVVLLVWTTLIGSMYL